MGAMGGHELLKSVKKESKSATLSDMHVKTPEQVQSEISIVTEYCERVFGVALDKESVKKLVAEIVSDKVEDYLYQRFRDWQVRDLLLLHQTLSEAKGIALEPIEAMTPKGKGKQKKNFIQ